MKKPLPFILAAAFLATALGAGAQTAPPKELNASERALVAGSREAIIETGITPAFFDRHFSVARVIDRPGDRRVAWNFSVGDHTTTVNDAVGFYTEDARRMDTHSVGTTLSSTSDIRRTITRRRAETLMSRCIGSNFENPQVEYRAHGPEGRAALMLTASAVVPPRPESPAARAQREREEREAAAAQPQGAQERDTLRRKSGAPSPILLLGYVDLVTGRCTVGRGQAGSPKPGQESPPK